MSPGAAGCDVSPETAPAGSTQVLEFASKAPAYCLPPMFRIEGAYTPGAVPTFTLYAAVVPNAVVRIKGWVPAATFDGTCTFTCPGLIYATNADWPPTVTEVESSDVGALEPLKSAVPQVRVAPARYVP